MTMSRLDIRRATAGSDPPTLTGFAGGGLLPVLVHARHTPATDADDAVIRAALVRYLANEGIDRDASHELYDEDAILEFPQSGERFRGKDTILDWRRRYPDRTAFRLRRLMGSGRFWSAEILISYEGGPPKFGIGLYEFRGTKAVREMVYVMDGFEAADWRAPWATRFDPLASIAPAEWRDGEPFGLEAELPVADPPPGLL
jgi:hypothetical protein